MATFAEDVEKQKIIDSRNAKIVSALVLVTAVAATVAIFGPEYAKPLSSVGFEVGTGAGISYGLFKLFGVALAD